MNAAAEVVREQDGPEEISLAEAYELDAMSERTEDLELWAKATHQKYVIEVGSGDGRIPAGVSQLCSPVRWVGMDLSEQMVQKARRRAPGWFRSVVGDAAASDTWDAAKRILGGSADVILVPYSTLFLLPHQHQVEMFRAAWNSIRPCGRLIVEVFVPKMPSGTRITVNACQTAGWWRETYFRVDEQSQITDVTRYYGPEDAQPVFQLREKLHWRRPEELPQLAYEAGFGSAELIGDDHPDVPAGHVVMVAK